jgi:hypothetical protein
MLVSDVVLAVDATSIEKCVNLLFISEFSHPGHVQNNFRSVDAIELDILILERSIFAMSNVGTTRSPVSSDFHHCFAISIV